MAHGRRRFLRGMLGGLGCALGLPAFEAMLNGNGTAYADGAPLPLRFGTWYFGNGVPAEAWAPMQTGADWLPSACLQPLADPTIKPFVSIISGTDLGIGFGDHIASRAVAFSGATLTPTGAQADAATAMPSCDQIAADLLGATSTFRSLELGVSRAYIMGGGTDEFSIAMKDGQLLPAEFSAKALFDRLFLGFSPDTRELDTRVGILDAVKADADALRGRLGAADRIKLDAHLGGIDELETRLLTEPPVCSVPTAPVDPQDTGTNEPLSTRHRLMVDVLVQAIACDLVRVFSVRFSQAIADVLFWEVGVNEGSHTLTHDPSKRQMYIDSVAFTMEQFAYLLQKLAAVTEGDATLLDRCAIYCSSDLADGQTHTVSDYPVVVAGRAGGALKSGEHVAATGKRTAVVPYTLLQAVGVQATSFGDATYGATEVLSELMA